MTLKWSESPNRYQGYLILIIQVIVTKTEEAGQILT